MRVALTKTEKMNHDKGMASREREEGKSVCSLSPILPAAKQSDRFLSLLLIWYETILTITVVCKQNESS